jgi:hypothetical protein
MKFIPVVGFSYYTENKRRIESQAFENEEFRKIYGCNNV